jgi:hypothetical protein
MIKTLVLLPHPLIARQRLSFGVYFEDGGGVGITCDEGAVYIGLDFAAICYFILVLLS